MMIEESYISLVSNEHRKKFGQFYTDPSIAKLMIDWLMGCNPDTIFDPAFGMGAFYLASKDCKFKGQFIGIEADKKSFDFYISNTNLDSNINLILRNEDYFSKWNDKWDSIVCNPPYLRFQNFLDRKKILGKLSNKLEVNVSGYTNIASAFLIKSILELKPYGRLAYIMPIEFLNTGYGKVIKNILMKHGVIREIIHVRDERGAFKSVVTTVCIILFEKINQSAETYFSYIDNVSNLKIYKIRKINAKNLNSDDKWLLFFDERKMETPKGFVPLSTYGKFKRGIATGANEFFSLSKEKINQIKLDNDEISLCITKSSQVKSTFFTYSDVNELIYKNSPIYIFNPKKEHLSDQAKRYVRYGEDRGFNDRYLTKNRKKWYFLENRQASPILFGVFSRGGYKIIRNETDAIHLTCFHGFNPNDLGSKYIDKIFLFLKSDLGAEALLKNKRKYGGSLDKFEPSDLNNILVPSPKQLDLLLNEEVLNEMRKLREEEYISNKMNKRINDLFKI